METIENQSKMGKIKKFLRAGILTTAILGSHGNAVGQNNNSDENTNNSSDYSQNLEYKTTIPFVAKDETSRTPEENVEIKLTELVSGIDSSFENGENIRIDDQATLDTYWKKMNQDPNMPIPQLKVGESVFLSTLGKLDTKKAIRIRKIVINESESQIFTESYDLVNGSNATSSPFDTVSASDLDKDLKIIFHNEQKEGVYDFSITSGSTTDPNGNTEFSGTKVIVQPHGTTD